MATVGLSLGLVTLSAGVANIGLPVLSDTLDVPSADIVWITVAYQTAVVAFGLPLAALGEIVGFRRIHVVGLGLFVLGAAACGLVNDFTGLVLARALQGLGAAGITAVNAAIIRQIVPRNLLGRGISVLALVVGAAHGAGPLVGSFVLEVADWRWMFLYNVPLGLLAMGMAVASVPSRRIARHRYDWLSAALTTVVLALCVISLDRIAKSDTIWFGLALAVLAIGAYAALARRQRGQANPLFPTDLLRHVPFALPALASSLLFTSQGLCFVALPFLLIETLGLSVLEAGLAVSIWPIAILVSAPLAGYVTDRYTRFPVGALGSMGGAVGILLAAVFAARHDPILLSVAIGFVGVAFAFFQNANTRSIILGAPAGRMGVASGAQSTARVFGQTLGPALVGINFHLFGEAGTQVSLGLAVAVSVLGGLASLRLWLLVRRNAEIPA